MKRFCRYENLKESLEILEGMGYRYIVKAKDKRFSSKLNKKAHVQLIAVKDLSEAYFLMADLKEDSRFNNVKCQPISNYEAIEVYTKDKTFSVGNVW